MLSEYPVFNPCKFYGTQNDDILKSGSKAANINVTSGQSNLTKDRIAAADGQFSCIRQVAPVCPAMWAHWCHLANTIKLCFLRPTQTAIRSVQPFLHSARQKVPTLYKHSCVLSNAGLSNALTETGICTSLKSDFYFRFHSPFNGQSALLNFICTWDLVLIC